VQRATISAQKIVFKELTYTGSVDGEPSECLGALDLIAEGKIRAETRPISFEEIPASLEKLQHGGVRGRFVALFA
jgi:propanol-preferring alcohol dehydrogenase